MAKTKEARKNANWHHSKRGFQRYFDSFPLSNAKRLKIKAFWRLRFKKRKRRTIILTGLS